MRTAIDPWFRSDPHPRTLETRRIPPGTGEVPIADLAIASHLIEAGGDVPTRFTPVVSGAFRDEEIRAEFQRNPGSTDVKSHDLRDVTLVPARMILFHGDERITETRYIVDDHDYWMQPAESREVREIDSGKTVVIGFNLAFRNYYHWMMQSLPAIHYSIQTIGAANCVLALPPLTWWQEETLALLGYAGLPRVQIDFDCHYHFQRAHWSEYLNGTADNFLSPRCQEVFDRLARGTDPLPDAPERYYVARLDTPNRVVSNEAEVRRLLESFGFVTLVPSYFAFTFQIGLLKSARFVVGAHGAGLTNLAFCAPGTTVLELVQSNFPIMLINRIAQERGLRYHAECFKCEADGDVHQQEWMIDIERLEAKLRSML